MRNLGAKYDLATHFYLGKLYFSKSQLKFQQFRFFRHGFQLGLFGIIHRFPLFMKKMLKTLKSPR